MSRKNTVALRPDIQNVTAIMASKLTRCPDLVNQL